VKRSTTHDYTRFRYGVDYEFEFIKGNSGAHMTGQGKGIRQGDCLLLKGRASIERYQVMEIDYYSSPSDMWIALLERIV
jgi:hypothetical protein